MACASCAANAANRNALNVQRVNRGSTSRGNRNLLVPQECTYTKEQIQLKLDELIVLRDITTNRASKHNIRVKIFKLKKILREYNETNCNQYLKTLNELL